MSTMERWDDDAFIMAVSDVIPEQEITHELAAQEAIADFKTERQASLMRGIYEQ
ncbi:hypothetical protein [Klebsiella aerogenes]|uniref:hypothetical protein n=1 Tax=Klebsiella aerogenes TaxID=548 RepID=UPI001DF446EF|nr:hypothetical protein [Klebsiella aerogenes]MCB8448176.1 hypothetical protein [Klebsiella aerogenes]MCB8452351.1 hypothetical protein [Klebsiella aerogenes]